MTDEQSESTEPHVWIVQKAYPFEGYENVAACLSEESGLELVRELNARSSTRHVLEPVPVVADVASARIEVLTLRQQLHQPGIPGEYQETREITWTFSDRFEPVVAVDMSTETEVVVYGHDHNAVRLLFAATLDARTDALSAPLIDQS